jgi:hypothetical protein
VGFAHIECLANFIEFHKTRFIVIELFKKLLASFPAWFASREIGWLEFQEKVEFTVSRHENSSSFTGKVGLVGHMREKFEEFFVVKFVVSIGIKLFQQFLGFLFGQVVFVDDLVEFNVPRSVGIEFSENNSKVNECGEKFVEIKFVVSIVVELFHDFYGIVFREFKSGTDFVEFNEPTVVLVEVSEESFASGPSWLADLELFRFEGEKLAFVQADDSHTWY